MTSRMKTCLAILIVFAPMLSWACRPSGMEHEVRFSPGSSTLDVQAAGSVAQWFLNARDHLKVFEIGLYGTALSGDAASGKRAVERIDTIERLIQSMNTGQAEIVKAVLERKERGYSPDWDIVHIESQPGCLKTNTCCPQPVKK